MKKVNIQVRWAAAHPGQDRQLPNVVTHSRLQRTTSVRSRWGSSSKTAPGSLSTGSPAGRTPPHGDVSMYSQANVRVGKCAAAPYPSVAVREAGRGKTARGWKGDRSGVRLNSRTVIISGDKRLSRLISYIHHTCEYKQYCSVGNTAKQCRLGLFQDSDVAGDLEE